MARNTTLQILRTTNKTDASIQNVTIQDGELLYDKATNKLFIGATTTNVGGMKQISAIPTTGDNITASKVTAKSTLTACNGFSATNGTIKIGTSTSNTIMLANASFTDATITNANIKKVEVGNPTSTTEYLLLDPYGSETGQLKINEASIIGALDASDIYSTSVTAANSDFTNATITNASITNATIGSLNIPTKSNVNSVIATIGNIKITSCNASFERITINGSTVEPVVGYTASQSFQNTLNAIKIGSTGYNLPQGGGSGDTVTITTATSAGKTGLKSIRVNSNATAYAPIISTTSTSGNTTIKSITVSDATINLPVPVIDNNLITGFQFGNGSPIEINGGVLSISSGSGISISSSTGEVTITNTGVRSLGGVTGVITKITNCDIDCNTNTATFSMIEACGATINLSLQSPIITATTVNATTIGLTSSATGGQTVSNTIYVNDTDGVSGAISRAFLYSKIGTAEERIPTVKVLSGTDPTLPFTSSSYAGIFTLAASGNKWKLMLGIGSTSVEIGHGGY